MWGNTATKQKSGGNTVAIHNVFFFKTTKLNSQPAQYEKKNQQRSFKKKERKKKPCMEIL
jgi:hypothetical protein